MAIDPGVDDATVHYRGGCAFLELKQWQAALASFDRVRTAPGMARLS
jgi:hypothetical protein